MKFAIKLLFRLIFQFVPIDEEDSSRILGKAKDWADTVRIDDDEDNKTPQIYRTIGKYCNMWGVQLGMCVVYLFAYQNMKSAFMESKDDDDDKFSNK